MKLRAIFSDIDGSVVHYSAKLQQQGYELAQIKDASEFNLEEFERDCGIQFKSQQSEQEKKEGEGKKEEEQEYDRRVHIWKHKESGALIPALPVPSATLGGGFVSLSTLKLVKQLREEHGVKFVLMTGARTSTFISRCKSSTLPQFDFGVCEGGGKIFARDSNLRNEESQNETVDQKWISCFSPEKIGPWRENQKLPPNQRKGPLWDLYRLIEQEGSDLLSRKKNASEEEEEKKSELKPKLDAKSFDTAFMVDVRPPASSTSASSSTPSTSNATAVVGMSQVSEIEENLKSLVAEKFSDSLTVVVNLGKGHISAKGCTKADVVEYLCREKFQIETYSERKEEEEEKEVKKEKEEEGENEVIAAIFDDENDLEFVKKCDFGFCPGIAHPAVREFLDNEIESRKEKCASARYRLCDQEGFVGTELALAQMLEMCKKKQK